MTLDEQRAEFKRISEALLIIAFTKPLDWRAAVKLRDRLGEALITEAAKQKRARYVANRKKRRESAPATNAIDPDEGIVTE